SGRAAVGCRRDGGSHRRPAVGGRRGDGGGGRARPHRRRSRGRTECRRVQEVPQRGGSGRLPRVTRRTQRGTCQAANRSTPVTSSANRVVHPMIATACHTSTRPLPTPTATSAVAVNIVGRRSGPSRLTPGTP